MASLLDELAINDLALSGRVEAYFLSLAASDATLGLLPRARALRMSQEFQSFHPLVRSLSSLIVSDDQTSDHYVLVLGTPLRGFVLHLSHDDGSRFVFDSLEAFLLAAHRANEAEVPLNEHHLPHSPVAKDQEALRDFLTSLLSQPGSGDVIPTLVGSLDLVDCAFLIRLIDDEDFYVGEAVAREIERRPSPHLLPVAEHCGHHPHVLVREAGSRALKRVRSLGSDQSG